MYRLMNYTELLRQFNITDEDIDYINSFILENMTGRGRFDGSRGDDLLGWVGSDKGDGGIRIKTVPLEISCYCDGAIRDIAMLYKVYHGYVSLAVCFVGTFTNVLNIIVLTQKDMKAVPINRILTGLAIADMLVMMEYVPFAIYKYLVLPRSKIFPYGWAVFVLFHMHFTQLLHTVSIALTLTLAVWRYIAIRFPRYNHTWCTERRCTIALFCSFVVSLLACTPSYFVFGIKGQTVYENGTMEVLYHVDAKYSMDRRSLYQMNFLLLGVFVKFLPCALLTVIICWLIKALYRARNRKQALKNYSLCVAKTNESSSTSKLHNLENSSESEKKNVSLKRANKFDKRTDRTTRMLVAVLLLFLITEIPQGVLGLLSATLDDCFFRNCYQKFGELMDILALLNGSINFVLYCSMSRQFRMIFGQLFKSKIINNWSLTTQQRNGIQSTYV